MTLAHAITTELWLSSRHILQVYKKKSGEVWLLRSNISKFNSIIESLGFTWVIKQVQVLGLVQKPKEPPSQQYYSDYQFSKLTLFCFCKYYLVLYKEQMQEDAMQEHVVQGPNMKISCEPRRIIWVHIV